jgi:hypothetical protein
MPDAPDAAVDDRPHEETEFFGSPSSEAGEGGRGMHLPHHAHWTPRALGIGALVFAGLAVAGMVLAISLVAGGASQAPRPSAPAAPPGTSPIAEPAGRSTPATSSDGTAGTASAAPATSGATASAQVTVTAAPGSPLKSLSVPPPGSLSMVMIPEGVQSARYAVTFQPYGWASTGRAGGQLFVQVVSSKPSDAAAKKLSRDWTGSNLTVFCSPDVVNSVAAGGIYAGTLELQPRVNVGVLVLLDARPM